MKKYVEMNIMNKGDDCMSYLVALDAGHGMHTSGKQSVKLDKDIVIDGKVVKKKGERIKENEWNRAVAKCCAAALKRCGIDYYYTADMTGKVDTLLSARAKRANAKKCDLLVSFHYNAIGSCDKWQTKCKGLLVLKTRGCQSGSTKIANLVHKHLMADIGYDHDYGVGVDVNWSGFTLAILRQTNMPATLIEFGFMDYREEAYKMVDPAFQKKCGEAVAKAICEYFGVKYKKEVVKEEPKDEKTEGIYRVRTDDLNVRKGPGVNFEKTNEVHKGDAFTIVEINGNWGKLKSGIGWINLNYTEKIK